MNPSTTFTELTLLFSTLPAPTGAKRAHEIVLLLKALLGYSCRIETPETWGEPWSTALSRLQVQPSTLSLPWRALHLSQTTCPEEEALIFEGGIRALLATVPMDYQIRSLLAGVPSLDTKSVADCIA